MNLTVDFAAGTGMGLVGTAISVCFDRPFESIIATISRKQI
jgi:hypothetical protein